jgi:hypothetical protein
MADFCRQCSISMSGNPDAVGDYESMGGVPHPTLEPDTGYPVLCEGCGPIVVDNDGWCICPDCLEQHDYGRQPFPEV